MADHWWEGRPWEMLCVLTPAFMLFLVRGCRHLGAELAAPADLSTWQWAVQGGVPCPPRGRKVLVGGAGSGRWRRNGRATPAGRSRVAPGRGARCFPGPWLLAPFPPCPPTPRAPRETWPRGHRTVRRPPWHCRRTSQTALAQSSLGSPPAVSVDVCSPGTRLCVECALRPTAPA